MKQPTYDVAIVGLGPVGCFAAILLADAGLKVVAIERELEVYTLPRAVNLDGEIIRACQPLGLAESINDIMQTIRPGERAGFANSKREWLFGADSMAVGSNGWQPSNMFDQPELESFLRDTALKHKNVNGLLGYEMTSFEQTSSQVSLQIKGSNTAVEAEYLIACDGAASTTRKALNIGWQSLGYDRDWLVVDVVTKEGHTLSNEVLQVCDPDRIHTYVATKDPYRRWEFRLNPGETEEQMLQPNAIHQLISQWTPRETYEIRRAAVYQFHAATASRWGTGRVFLAGDAAHQTPPFLGQGMNTGMRDAINLAWKLKMVLNGTCKTRLLDSYQSERNAHAHDLVSWAVSLGHLMEHLAETEACERAGKPPPEPSQALTTSGYGQGREQPPIRTGIVLEHQLSNKGITGYLMPQPLVQLSNGREVRLDELYGSEFALIQPIQSRLNPTSQRIVEQLNIQLVDVSTLTLVSGKLPRQLTEGECILVRPDKLVFGHTSKTLSVDGLLCELKESLVLSDD